MRKDKTNLPYIHDILNAINAIALYIQEAPEKKEFISGKGLYQDAIVRNIEVIGEATKRLSDDFKAKHAEVPWKQMAGMRDKVVHEYADIDWEEVWIVATEDINHLRKVLEELEEQPNDNTRC